MSGEGLFRRINPFELSVRLEGNNIGTGQSVFPGDLSHVGEHLEELERTVSPPLALEADAEVVAFDAPLGRLIDKNCEGVTRALGLTHLRRLSAGGRFGAGQTVRKLIFVNPIITGSAA
jgi:hypothetical protein